MEERAIPKGGHYGDERRGQMTTRPPVGRVRHDRKARFAEMDPDLVGTPGLELALDKSDTR